MTQNANFILNGLSENDDNDGWPLTHMTKIAHFQKDMPRVGNTGGHHYVLWKLPSITKTLIKLRPQLYYFNLNILYTESNFPHEIKLGLGLMWIAIRILVFEPIDFYQSY